MPDVYIFDEAYGPTDVVLRLSAAAGGGGATFYTRNLAEIVVGVAVLSRLVNSQRGQSEAFPTTSSPNRTLAALRQSAETFSTTDALSRFAALQRSSSESVPTISSPSRQSQSVRSLAESLVTLDTLSRIATYLRPTTETHPTDSSVVGFRPGQTFERFLAEIVSTISTPSRLYVANRSLTETLATTHAVNRILAYLRGADESYVTLAVVAHDLTAVLDSIIRAYSLNLTRSEHRHLTHLVTGAYFDIRL